MKLNPALRSSVVLFLGAGASAPLGKMLMGDFVNHLATVEGIGITHLFQAIVRKNPDLEFLLEELGDLESKAYLDYNSMYGMGGGEPLFKSTALEAALLRHSVEHEVFRHYRSFDETTRRKIKPHFLPLFETISKFLKDGEPLIVFTTNYDPAVEEFVRQMPKDYALFDGFSFNPRFREDIWSETSFESWIPSTDGHRDVVLIKLHGSTNWFMHQGRVIRGPSVYTAQDNSVSNVLIYPARRKVAADDPFFTAYYLFQQILRSAKCLVAVGYSFRDLDALSKLREATLDNDELGVGIVDPRAEEIEMQLVGRYIPAAGIQGIYNPAMPHLPSSPNAQLVPAIEKFIKHNITQERSR